MEDAQPTGVSTVDPAVARQWLSSGQAALIDVREADEHTRERIPGSLLHPLSTLHAAGLSAMRKPKLILHCQTGRRSAEACRRVAGLLPGVEVHSLEGGLRGWKQERLPLERAGGMALMSTMRQVQLVVGAGVLAGVALGALVSPLWLVVPAFFGAGLVFAGSTGWCGLAALLGLMPWNRGTGGGACRMVEGGPP